MAKMLKPMIILLFVLSIAALALGFQLFSKREVLKGRVVKLEDSTQAIARQIQYKGLNAQQLQDYASMDGQLRPLQKAAQNQYEELQETKANLESTEGQLASTQGTLQQTEADLTTSQAEVDRLVNETREQKSDIAQKIRNIESLEQAQAVMEEQVDQLERGLEATQAQLLEREREYDDLLKEYTQIVRSIEGGEGGPAVELDPGISGNILVASPEWNFVIVDLGASAGLQEQVQLLVHRDRELVGRIRITQVQETLSIAEVMNDWQVTPVASGDQVIPPGT